MSSVAKPVSRMHDIVLGIEEPVAYRLTCEIGRFSGRESIAVAPSFAELRQRLAASGPAVILVGYRLLEGMPLIELPAADTQRLQTVVDLAVRLRETIRRIGTLSAAADVNVKQPTKIGI